MAIRLHHGREAEEFMRKTIRHFEARRGNAGAAGAWRQILAALHAMEDRSEPEPPPE